MMTTPDMMTKLHTLVVRIGGLMANVDIGKVKNYISIVFVTFHVPLTDHTPHRPYKHIPLYKHLMKAY